MIIYMRNDEHTDDADRGHCDLFFCIICSLQALLDSPGIACGEHHKDTECKQRHKDYEKRVINIAR